MSDIPYLGKRFNNGWHICRNYWGGYAAYPYDALRAKAHESAESKLLWDDVETLSEEMFEDVFKWESARQAFVWSLYQSRFFMKFGFEPSMPEGLSKGPIAARSIAAIEEETGRRLRA